MRLEAALFGNPNTGKTSLFNLLTGSYELVGNWSGATVEKKIGRLKDNLGTLVDLPGLYALSPLSRDETVATAFLLNSSFTAAIDIVDASQLARNLQLTIELLEFGRPMILALNMIDVARHRGLTINHQKLAECLNVPVVPIVARTGRGCHALSGLLAKRIDSAGTPFHLDYGKETEKAILDLSQLIHDRTIDRRWLAIQYLQGNRTVSDAIQAHADSEAAKRIVTKLDRTLKNEDAGMTVPRQIYQRRKQYIDDILSVVTEEKQNGKSTLSDRLDAIATNKILGMPLFFAIMLFIFQATFNWIGNPVSGILDHFISGQLTEWTRAGLDGIGVLPFIRDVVLNGIIAGVGGVIVFVPQIFVLFFFISWIEDSGYMARVALVMDRLMQAVGLNGKAFIPLVIGFGCNIPGIMAARMIEQPKERLLTVLISPLMSCSARLTVYTLFAGVFFARYQALVVLSLYILSIAVAMVMAKLFSLFLKKGPSVFVVELPPYRFPNLLMILRSTWDKAKGFVRKATTFILGGTILIWLLSYTGFGGIHVAINQSFLAALCVLIAPVFAPLGFGTWQAVSALIAGFMAKEAVVSTMAVVYHASAGSTLTTSVRQAFTPLQALSFMVFTMFYIPCISSIPAIKQEAGSTRLALFTIGYCLVLAYIVSFIVYRTGIILGY